MVTNQTFDVAVIGAGVFGAWTAHELRRHGASVVLLDAYGPGNSRASSGGESRIIRMGYGPDEVYTRSAQRSLTLWKQLFEENQSSELFQRTGVLWLARESDDYCSATLQTLRQNNVTCERLDHDELIARYPQLNLAAVSWGILEPESGVLLARDAVSCVVTQAIAAGVTHLAAAITPPGVDQADELNQVETSSGDKIIAKQFVFACGPWLPKLFPDLLGELIHVTRQEVVFFGTPAGDERFKPQHMPAWVDFNDLVYGIPDIKNRGFKIAIDAHGPDFDPDTGDRTISTGGLAAVRAYLATRVPALSDAPVTETRVYQYENTSNGDFLIDRHPQFRNVWLVGGGSGHGFKHGPAVGEQVAGLVRGGGPVEPRFSLGTKEKVQQRTVF